MKPSTVISSDVSVIVPLYNGAAYVGEALESILAQALPPREIIVVDDASTDAGPAIAAGYPGVRVVRQEHAGPPAAMNRGVGEAAGAYLAFLDADDLWAPDKLRVQLERLAAEDAPDLVFGWVRQFISPELSAAAKGSILCPAEPMPGYASGAMLARRSAFDRVGAFNPAQIVGAFIDWFNRGREAGLRTALPDGIVLRRRLHEHNLSRTRPDARTALASVVKAALDRRRHASS